MRDFFRAHWKAIVTILALVVLAMLTLSPTAASPHMDDGPSLSARLQTHVTAIASTEHDSAAAARYIEHTLATGGYRVRRQADDAGGRRVRNIEASIANVDPGARPARIFIVGARYDSAPGVNGNDNGNDGGGGTAAVLELARLLKDMHPSRGTELKFIFFVGAARPGVENRFPGAGNFIAFLGTLESSRWVADAFSAFRAGADPLAQGLAAPAYVQGVTLSDHASYNRFGYPALMVTDTAFMRYPYYRTAGDTPDKLDYDGVARVVSALAHTIDALAGAKRG